MEIIITNQTRYKDIPDKTSVVGVGDPTAEATPLHKKFQE